MQQSEADSEQAIGNEEGGQGDLVPPSLTAESGAEDEPASIEGELVDDEDLPPELRAEVLQVARRALAWQAPLPPPDVYEQYRRIDPELADAIKRDFIRRSDQLDASYRSDQAAIDRDYDLEDRNLKIVERQSGADITVRYRGQWFSFVFLPLLAILGFIVLMWGPKNDVAYLVAAILIAPIPIATGIAVVKGRMTDNERDIIKAAIPHLGRHPAIPAKDSDKQLPPASS